MMWLQSPSLDRYLWHLVFGLLLGFFVLFCFLLTYLFIGSLGLESGRGAGEGAV